MKEAIRIAIQMGTSKVIKKSESQVSINSILDGNETSKPIKNLVENIISLEKKIETGSNRILFRSTGWAQN